MRRTLSPRVTKVSKKMRAHQSFEIELEGENKKKQNDDRAKSSEESRPDESAQEYKPPGSGPVKKSPDAVVRQQKAENGGAGRRQVPGCVRYWSTQYRWPLAPWRIRAAQDYTKRKGQTDLSTVFRMKVVPERKNRPAIFPLENWHRLGRKGKIADDGAQDVILISPPQRRSLI